MTRFSAAVSFGPPQLDLATTQQLSRAASAQKTHARIEPILRRRPVGGSTSGERARRLLLRTIVPPAMLAVGVMSLGGVLGATGHVATSGEIWTLSGFARIVLMSIALLTVIGQAVAIVRRTFLGRWIGRRKPLARGMRRPTAAGPAHGIPLLDVLSADELAILAYSDLGRQEGLGVGRRGGERWLDTILWLALSAAGIALAAWATLTLGLSAAGAVAAGALAPRAILLSAFTVLGGIGVAFLARGAYIAFVDRRRRRRRPAILRLLRYLLRLIGGRSPRSPGPLVSTPFGAVVTSLIAIVLAASVAWVVGFGPDLFAAERPTGAGAAPPGVPAAVAAPPTIPSASGVPRVTAPPPSATPGSTASAALSVAPSMMGAPTPATTLHVKPAPTLLPAVTAPPTLLPAVTAPPTLLPAVTAPPPPTIDPTDSDQDGVPDVIEAAYVSDPGDPHSTPENKLYDAAYQLVTCDDTSDNDGDFLIDWSGGLLNQNPVGPDPDCVP